MKLETLRKFALSLADVTEQPHHDYGSWRVRGKIFVTIPPAGEAVHLFVAEDVREQALAMYPEWAQKLLWGSKVVGLRVLLAAATPASVKALVQQAYEKAGATKTRARRAAP